MLDNFCQIRQMFACQWGDPSNKSLLLRLLKLIEPNAIEAVAATLVRSWTHHEAPMIGASQWASVKSIGHSLSE